MICYDFGEDNTLKAPPVLVEWPTCCLRDHAFQLRGPRADANGRPGRAIFLVGSWNLAQLSDDLQCLSK
ncbi:unnamed protein product [Protopolystoma xenopodis]|uniref:Uncharacterized protein n=1 Tax=Protopolystoma xenopodis TaxID=117903 RepID=A0A448WK63_9PLAT|nr:unnamed protein product [Protopolystoma xenopodis]